MIRTLSLMALLLVSGCATTVAVPVIDNQSPVSIPLVQPMVLSPVVWMVLTPTDVASSAQLSVKAAPVLFSLDEDGYKALATNLVEIHRYIEEQKAVVKMLKGVLADRSIPVVDPTANRPLTAAKGPPAP